MVCKNLIIVTILEKEFLIKAAIGWKIKSLHSLVDRAGDCISRCKLNNSTVTYADRTEIAINSTSKHNLMKQDEGTKNGNQHNIARSAEYECQVKNWHSIFFKSHSLIQIYYV